MVQKYLEERNCDTVAEYYYYIKREVKKVEQKQVGIKKHYAVKSCCCLEHSGYCAEIVVKEWMESAEAKEHGTEKLMERVSG